MPTLDDFDFLVLGVFRAPLRRMRRAAEAALQPFGSYELTDGPLNIDSIYRGSPPPGGAHEARAVLFEPATSRGTTALIANLQDGWLTLCNVLAMRVPGEHLLVRSSIERDPVPDLQVWDGHESVRYVGALRDAPSWTFYTEGTPRPFEEPERYKRRRIADRIDRALLVAYLEKLGWPLEKPAFWTSRLPALYVREHWKKPPKTRRSRR